MGIESMLRRQAQSSSASPAFVFSAGLRSYGEFESRVCALAKGLIDAGIRRGDGVGVWLSNCPEFFESMYAAWKVGAYAVPMQARLRPAEIAHQCTDSEVSALVTSVELMAALAAHDDRLLEGKLVIAVGDGETGIPTKSYETFIASNLGEKSPEDDWEDADLAWLFYTSGTTGRPKAACWTRGNITFGRMQYLIETHNFSRSDTYLLWGPATHGAGVFAWYALTRGAKIVIPDLTHPQLSLAEVIEQHEVTALFATPTMIKKLTDELAPNGRGLPSLKHVYYGGASMPVEHLRQAVRCMGHIFTQGYAQAECGGSISALSADDHRSALDDPAHKQRLESVGRPREGTRIRILDNSNSVVDQGCVGEIAVSGPTTVHQYWRQPRASRETFRDTWVMTGDLGRIDTDGFLYVVGRKRDVIMSGGMNVYPAEIEQLLARHPSVSECCVIGVPDELYAEAVCAVIVKRAGFAPNSEELIGYVLEHLASYKKPRSVIFVDELPKNANGKVLKAAIQQKYSKTE